jgi:8-oxo-dGTP pyrophosphatase MutT (NUDIX family)
VLFIARARTGSVHDGQIAFPGGALEPQDQGQATRAALREAQEEVGLSPTTLQVMGFLPAVAIPVSGYAVMPVVAWCRGAPEVLQPHAGEVERTFFVPLQELRAVRTWERRTRGGRTGLWPVFPTSQGRIWGATAIILHALLRRSPPGMPPTPPPAPRAAATTR